MIDLGPSCLEWTNLPDESGIACDIGLSRLHASNKLTEIASNNTIQAKNFIIYLKLNPHQI